MITLAVDIGGTKISAALISDDGSFLLKKQISTPHERCPDEMTGWICPYISRQSWRAERVSSEKYNGRYNWFKWKCDK